MAEPARKLNLPKADDNKSDVVLLLPNTASLDGRSVTIDKVFIGQGLFIPKPDEYLPLKKGSSLAFEGNGLDIFKSANFSGKPVLKKSDSNDSRIAFTVPDLATLIRGDGVFSVKLTTWSNHNLTLQPSAIYSDKKEDEEEEENRNTSYADSSQANKAGEDAPAKNVVLPFRSKPVSVNDAKPGQKKVGASSKVESKKIASDEQAEDLYDQEEIQSNVEQQPLPETVKQSFELVGEYIDKNPTVIVNSAVRGEVLAGLKSGNLSNLSQEAHVALQASLSSQAISQTGSLSNQLQAASRIVRQQSEIVRAGGAISSSGTISGNLQTSTGGSGSISTAISGGGGSLNVTASAQTQVLGQNQNTGSPGTQGSVEESVLASSPTRGSGGQQINANLSKTSQAVGSQAPSSPARVAKAPPSVQQNMDIVGEEIYKNPGLIPNNETRQEILEGLGRGNVENLSPAGKENLQMALKDLGKQSANGQPTKQAQAAQDLQAYLGDEGELGQGQQPKTEEDGQFPGKGDVDGVGPKPPAGMENLAKNDANLGQKLGDISANKDKANTGPGSEKSLSRAGLGGGLGAAAPLASGGAAPAPLAAEGNEPASALAAPPQNPNDPAKSGQTDPDAKPAEDEDEDEDDQPAVPNFQNPAAQADNSPVLDAEIKEAATLVNHFINEQLLYWAIMAWSFSIVSFGLTILVGAILGDFLWALKKPLIKFAVGRIRLPLLKGDLFKRAGDKLADEIKFSYAVKANIIAMNSLAVLLIILIFLIFTGLLWASCNSYGAQFGAFISGFSEAYGSVCQAFKGGGGGGGGGGVTGSF